MLYLNPKIENNYFFKWFHINSLIFIFIVSDYIEKKKSIKCKYESIKKYLGKLNFRYICFNI